MMWTRRVQQLRGRRDRPSLQKVCETASVTFPRNETERVLAGASSMSILPPRRGRREHSTFSEFCEVFHQHPYGSVEKILAPAVYHYETRRWSECEEGLYLSRVPFKPTHWRVAEELDERFEIRWS